MRTVKVEELSPETFSPLGTYFQLLNPSAPRIGQPPVEFYRDLGQLELGGARPSFSTCRVEPREPVIEVCEYHSRTGEGILPLDSDVLLHLAPATPKDAPVPLESLRVFRVPRGTMVLLRPGTWHHGPFTLQGPANVLIVLPERTYANDTVVALLEPEERVRIEV